MNNEAEIGEGVVAWLEAQHWDVYQEVKSYGGRVADIVATNGNLVWVIECKRSLSLTVMDQARHWPVHFRSIAVTKPKGRRGDRRTAYNVAKQFFKVGVLEVEKIDLREGVEYRVDVVIPAPLMREHHKLSKRIKNDLVPEQKIFAKAGTRGAGIYTPYKGTMLRVRKFIEKTPGCTIKEIMDDLGKMHYSSIASARSTIPKSLLTIESEWCRVDKENRPFRFYIKES